jgi:hypothetical protein
MTPKPGMQHDHPLTSEPIFIPSSGKYVWLGKCWLSALVFAQFNSFTTERGFDEDEKEEEDKGEGKSNGKKKAEVVIPDSQLRSEIQVGHHSILGLLDLSLPLQTFCKLIFSTSYAIPDSQCTGVSYTT